jgi:hypothetical protein
VRKLRGPTLPELFWNLPNDHWPFYFVRAVLHFGEEERNIPILAHLPVQGRVALVGVGPQVEPDVVERVGAVVGVGDGLEGAERVPRVIQADVYLVVGLLLEVFLRGSQQGQAKEQGQKVSHRVAVSRAKIGGVIHRRAVAR